MTLFLLFIEFFKLGLFTFGSGYAMIPLIKETVLRHNWMTEELFYNFLGLCESNPGPIATDMATFIGMHIGGIWGAVLATVGVILPSFIIIIIVSKVVKKFISNKRFKSVLDGVKPVAGALIFSAGVALVLNLLGFQKLNLFSFNLYSFIVFGVMSIIYLAVKVFAQKEINSILFILLSVGVGIGFGVLM